MKVQFYVAVGILCLVGAATRQVSAQEPAQAGPEHKLLAELEGEWSAVIKFGTEESKGTSSSKMGLGGLWLLTEFKSELGGAPFEGRGIDGYDLDKKKHVAIWVDSMTSTPMIFEGTYDAKTKTMTMHGDGKGPDGKASKFKITTTIPDKDHQVFKMYLVPADAKEVLMMTIEYTRKK